MYDFVVIGNPAFYRNKKHTSDNPEMELTSGAVYAAITASKLGVDNIAIVGSAGAEVKQRVIPLFHNADIEFYLLDSSQSNIFDVFLDTQGNERVSVLGTAKEIGIRDIPDEYLSAKMILLSPVFREIHVEFLEWLSDSSDALILLDPRFRRISDDGRVRLMGDHRVAEDALEFVDVIKPSRLESQIMTGESDPYLASEMLVESGADIAIVTLGEEGSIIFEGKDFYQVPAFELESANGVGAGDSYLAGFAYQLLNERPLAECGAFASAVASILIESEDGPEFILDESKLVERTNNLLERVTIR
ncbi:MAG: PfkB family carbohydrate kinase [Candidatus Thorarchaeota archaeon]